MSIYANIGGSKKELAGSGNSIPGAIGTSVNFLYYSSSYRSDRKPSGIPVPDDMLSHTLPSTGNVFVITIDNGTIFTRKDRDIELYHAFYIYKPATNECASFSLAPFKFTSYIFSSDCVLETITYTESGVLSKLKCCAYYEYNFEHYCLDILSISGRTISMDENYSYNYNDPDEAYRKSITLSYIAIG